MELSFYKTFYQDVKETVNKKNNSENKVKELKFIIKMYASKLENVKIVEQGSVRDVGEIFPNKTHGEIPLTQEAPNADAV